MMKASQVLVAALLLAFSASGSSAQQVWRWSQTSGSNSVSDPAINWTVGMAPSAVSPSARSMMAGIARYRDDISGALTTSGTSTAYVLTTNQGLSSTPNDGQMIAFTPHTTNGIAPTITTDGGNTYPIQTAPGSAVGAATLIAGTPYSAKFSSAAGAWVLRDFYSSAFNVPLGGLLPSTIATPPNSNFILPAGQCISTVTYAAYWAALGSPASGSCPGGQFAVIDLRGRVLAALDNLNGSAANRLTSSSTGCGTAMTSVGATCSNGSESKTLVTANLPPYTPSISVSVTFPTTVTGHSPNNIFTPGGCCVGYGGGSSGGTALDISGLSMNSAVTPGAQGGTSTPLPVVQPTVAVTYFLRVL
ncbi:hypothetical protein SAMN05216330_104454 [Bradyrhizobium sp. Ghvi]|uniref:phage tail protein n=1 Tax=Bradyrhizobium sp. Ghvi TaxID=1855319 RepID=UPI0008EA3688|nr:phage tail protein [Bradyrhizobium sp. Ghvi]SFO74281.1 hypothetical protein SAMN05216330_104454 [Bradyrhizobium sp. Ghvi]